MSRATEGRELRRYLAGFQRWLWFLGLCTILPAVVAYALATTRTPLYRATAELTVDQSQVGQDVYTSTLASVQQAQNYVELIGQPVVLQRAASHVQHISTETLASEVQVSAQSGTNVIEIAVNDHNPARAAELANAVAAAFISLQQNARLGEFTAAQQRVESELAQVSSQISQFRSQIAAVGGSGASANSAATQILQNNLDAALARQTTLSTLDSQLTADMLMASTSIRVFQPAVAPSAPVGPSPRLIALIGAAAGLIVAVGGVLVILHFDDHVYSAEDVETMVSIPVLGTIHSPVGVATAIDRPRKGRLPPAWPTSKGRTFAVFEEYRSICMYLMRSPNVGGPLRTIVVTSPTEGEGKTATAINLAEAFARLGRRVLLVDADVRNACVHMHLGLDNTSGLSTCLLNSNGRVGDHAPLQVVPTAQNLSVLTAGPIQAGGADLLSWDALATISERVWRRDNADSRFDLLIVDAPALRSGADAVALAADADGTIIVGRAGYTRKAHLAEAKVRLQRVDAHVLGAVLSQADRSWNGERVTVTLNRLAHLGRPRSTDTVPAAVQAAGVSKEQTREMVDSEP